MNVETDNPSREEILSEEETEALLAGIEDGSVETGGGHGRPSGETRLYDFSDCERVARGTLPTLQIINTRIARTLQTSLGELLRKPIQVEARPNRLPRHAEHLPTLPTPASLNLVRLRPLTGTILVVPTNPLIHLSVDCFFGGKGIIRDNEPSREFTPVEIRIVALLLDAVFAALTDGWRPVLKLTPELVGQEQNPHFAAIASGPDRVIVTEFSVRHEEHEAPLQLIIPRAMLDPIEELLDTAPRGDDSEHDDAWHGALRRRLASAPIPLRAALTTTRLRLGAVLDLQAGDVIPVNLPEEILLEASDTPLFTGRAGASRKRNAIELTGRTKRNTTEKIEEQQ